MCISATLVMAAVAVTTAAAGTVMSVRAANANKAGAQYEADLVRKQMNEQREAATLQAMQQENGRMSQFARARSAALASIGASGVQEHISFNQGIDPANNVVLMDDVRAARLNLVGQQSTLRDQIDVAQFGARMAGFNSGVAKVGAFADFANSAMSAFTFYGNNRAPKPVAA